MPRLQLPTCVPILCRLSVCKKIGLGYVPAVAFMLAVGIASLLTLRSPEVQASVGVLPLLVVAGTVVAGAASIAAMLTAFSVGERVRAVLVAAEGAAGGDLNQHVAARPDGDEVDRLATSFNTMAAELRELIAGEQHARAEAESASDAKSRFLSTMSHELRTPLTVLIGFSDLLEECASDRLSDGETRYLRHMNQAAQHLLSIVNDALDLSRVEAGHTTVEPQSIELGELLDPVFESVRPLADDRGHRFTMEVPRGTVTVAADPLRVRQVLYNLLSNAMKFTPAGGSVTLRATVAGSDLLLEVEDTGIGIPPELHHRVFGLFERLHGGRIEASGTGLGLALSKRLIELHGGELDFESQLDVGTTFRVRLPAAVTAAAGARPMESSYDGRLTALLEAVAGHEPATGGLRVLLVDDEQLNTRLFADVLEADGHSVVIEHDGLAGEGRVMAEPFDVLLTDIRMPGMRGDDLCRLLRSRGMDLPIIAISANAMPTEINEGLSAGFDAYLTKPITPRALRDAVREVVERHHRVSAARGLATA